MRTDTTAPPDDPAAIMGVRSYGHLAAHHGHDLSVEIYGGDASVALECETCQSILIAFENVPGREASLAALVALALRHRLESRHLAPHLTIAATEHASVVNQQGLHSQLAHLLAIVGAQSASELIERVASETRRP